MGKRLGVAIVPAGKVEEECFGVFMAGANLDVAAWHAYATACGDREADKHAKLQHWMLERHNRCKEQARQLVNSLDSHQCRIFMFAQSKKTC